MNKQPSGLGVLSVLLITIGLFGLIYFLAFFDTSVPVPRVNPSDYGLTELPFSQPSRVNNLGLMQDRQIGVIVCSVILFIGITLAMFEFHRRSQAGLKCPHCFGNVPMNASKCKHCGSDISVVRQSSNHESYYVSKEGNAVEGPFTAQQLRALLATGVVTRETLVAKRGDSGWYELRDVIQ